MPAHLETAQNPIVLVTETPRTRTLIERLAGPFDTRSLVIPESMRTAAIPLGDQVRELHERYATRAGIIAIGDKAARTAIQVREELPKAAGRLALIGTTNEVEEGIPSSVIPDVLVFRPSHRAEEPVPGISYVVYELKGPHARISLAEEGPEAFKTNGEHRNVITLGDFFSGRLRSPQC